MYVTLLECSEVRRKYVIYKNEHDSGFVGYLVIEKYDTYWNIELMEIAVVKRQGYGTYLLQYVIKDMTDMTKLITTHPITPEARQFFVKNGFDKDTYYYHI